MHFTHAICIIYNNEDSKSCASNVVPVQERDYFVSYLPSEFSCH